MPFSLSANGITYWEGKAELWFSPYQGSHSVGMKITCDSARSDIPAGPGTIDLVPRR